MSIGQPGVRAAIVEGAGGTAAVVHGGDDGRVRGQSIGNVDVKARAAWVGTKVGDLGKGGGVRETDKGEEARGNA